MQKKILSRVLNANSIKINFNKIRKEKKIESI